MKWRERDGWLTFVAQGFVGGAIGNATGYSVSMNEAVALALVLDAADDRNWDELLRCLVSPEAESSRQWVRHETGTLVSIIDGMGLDKEGEIALLFSQAPSRPVGSFLEAALPALIARARLDDKEGWRAAAAACLALSELRTTDNERSVLRQAASLHQDDWGSERVSLAVSLALAVSRSGEVFDALTRSDSDGVTSTAWIVRDALGSLADLSLEVEAGVDEAEADADLGESTSMPDVAPVRDWEVMAARDFGAARREAGLARARQDAGKALVESVELGRFARVVAAARAAHWGGSIDQFERTDTLAVDLCRALAAYSRLQGEGSLLGFAAAETLEGGPQGPALEWLGILRD